MQAQRAQFTVELECGHTAQWPEVPIAPDADLPWVGKPVRCRRCGEIRLIAEVEPGRVDIETITLSEAEPRQTPAGASGEAWQAGDKVTVFYSTEDGAFGYCFHGVGQGGLAYESEDVTGFHSPQEALEAAREEYTLGAGDPVWRLWAEGPVEAPGAPEDSLEPPPGRGAFL